MHRVSATVVMYGGAEETRRCLNSLVQYTTGVDLSLYLVDNASPDGALEALKQGPLPPELHIMAMKENRGFGAGHNAVLPLLDSDYHAVVNPDIEIDSDVLAGMAQWMAARPDVAIATPQLMNPDGTEQYTAKRRPALLPLLARQLPLPFLRGSERHYLMLDDYPTRPTDIEFCSGAFFMIKTEVFKQMGGFDESYFMYVEDADITQKALRYGRAVFLPQYRVIHGWHRAAHRKPRQFMWQLRSMLRYFRKWGFRWK